ncbi:MAG: DegV family protein [Suipraeoptans sp.]
MKEYIITTDSNSDLPKEYVEKYHMTIIPQYYSFDDVVYGDELNLTPEEFYNKMEVGELPTSMANNPAVIKERFEKILKEDKDILHIAFSSALSGSYNNVAMVADELMEEYKGSKIIVIDSLNVSLGETLLLLYAIKLMEDGKSIEEVANWLDNNKKNCFVEFTVNDVNHLYRGGRISKTASVVLGIVNIKPLLTLTPEGGLSSLGTVRGRKRSLSTLVNNMTNRLNNGGICKRAGIVHANSLDDANHVASLIYESHPDIEVIINDISPSIGTHAGPGTVGLMYYIEQ